MFVAYTRVSTQRQGASGLGLEAQLEAVETYARSVGGSILATFTEIESGTLKDRPELTKALAQCRKTKSILLIARLDRLSRSLVFVAQLLEANVEIRAADVPSANRMMIQMLAVFAEHERSMISQRTKAALAAAKARGVKLGRNGAVLAAGHRMQASQFAETVRHDVEKARSAGHRSTRAVAAWLNESRVSTRSGGMWHAASVGRLLRRLGDHEARL